MYPPPLRRKRGDGYDNTWATQITAHDIPLSSTFWCPQNSAPHDSPLPTLLQCLQHFTADGIPLFISFYCLRHFTVHDIGFHCPQNSNILAIPEFFSGSFASRPNCLVTARCTFIDILFSKE